MNEQLLRQVQHHILEEPLRLYMAEFRKKKSNDAPFVRDYYYNHRPFASCGYAACIAGWGGILRPRSILHPSTFFQPRSWGQYADLFELTVPESYRLFDPQRWPEQFMKGTRDDGSLETAQVACARVDFFIDTQGTDDERYIRPEPEREEVLYGGA